MCGRRESGLARDLRRESSDSRPPVTDTLGRQQEVRIISEPDLFRLVVNSKLPTAERFERWVFEEVLPAIRKTGAYTVPAR